MKRVEYFHWWVTSETSGKRVKTRYAMTREIALERYPDAVPVEGSLEVRDVPETDAEIAAASTSAFQRGLSGLSRRPLGV